MRHGHSHGFERRAQVNGLHDFEFGGIDDADGGIVFIGDVHAGAIRQERDAARPASDFDGLHRLDAVAVSTTVTVPASSEVA